MANGIKEKAETEKSIKKNFVFNLVYQILVLLAPLLVTPYVSRVLGVDGVGHYSYAASIVSYFSLFAVLGTSMYGQRAIGYAQKDVAERSRLFWEVFLFRLLTSAVSLGSYAIYVCLAAQESFTICLILTLNIANVVVDITWFLQGMEEFAKTTSTSILFRILSIASVFLFVKDASDLPLYVLLMSVFTIAPNLVLWLYLPKYLCKVKGIRPFKDIKSIVQLFLPTIAVQLYTVVDKSMIGWFADGYTENGYYEQAEKIVRMTIAAVTALGTVMIPRISRKFKEGDNEQVSYYIYKSYRFVWMLAIAIMFGLIAVSDIFVPIFFGEGYEKCVILITILSAQAVLIGLSNVTGLQYFVPIGKQNVLTCTVVIGAVVNVCLNLILIPFFSSIGAAIASVVAELCVTVSGFIYVCKTKRFDLKKIFGSSFKYWVAGFSMAASVFVIKHFLPTKTWSLCVLIVIGAVVYFLLLLLLRDALTLEMCRKGLAVIRRPFMKRSQENEKADKTESAVKNDGLDDSIQDDSFDGDKKIPHGGTESRQNE